MNDTDDAKRVNQYIRDYRDHHHRSRRIQWWLANCAIVGACIGTAIVLLTANSVIVTALLGN